MMNPQRELPVILPVKPRPSHPDEPQKEPEPYTVPVPRKLPDVPDIPQPDPDEPEF